ncbi:hypothetical protein F5B19DRAFT_496851 [Rostrohypoxylon terebratum]|nr:hypothetical protein F5B19DRAFT_496851 [Rostrohypoxylon terebratum]
MFMTVAFGGLTDAQPVLGSSATSKSYVRVRLGFAAVPLVIIIAAAAGALSLCLLFHGIDEDLHRHFPDRGEGLEEKRRRVKDVKVQLGVAGDRASLLRT